MNVRKKYDRKVMNRGAYCWGILLAAVILLVPGPLTADPGDTAMGIGQAKAKKLPITGALKSECLKRYPNPRIRYDRTDSEGRIYIPVTNWASYDNGMFRKAPELPPCGLNKSSSRTWVDIYDGGTNKRLYGFCAFDSKDDLQKIWFMPKAKSGKVYIILNDRACRRKYRSNTISYGSVAAKECRKRYPNPRIRYDRTDSAGRIYIPVVNWSAYDNTMFRKAPELPPCGKNANSSRTWVDIYDGATNKRIYGFCAFDSKDDLQKIWFMPKAKSGKVYIIINDRACRRKYRSNTISYGSVRANECLKRYPNPRIRYDRTDSAGRIYIPVVNWSAYDNTMFRKAPELPPCGKNANSSRTWVDIYDGATNQRIYGFCAFGTKDDLQKVWFMPKKKSGKVYIIINDRACERKYRSNTISYGGKRGSECAKRYPNPRIRFDRTDAGGRVYIPVVNWNVYDNTLFRKAPELPPCGGNANSSRTWVNIYDAATKKKIYGFCAFGSKDDLKTIWFKPQKGKRGSVYIIIKDRACTRKYQSNTIRWKLK